MDNCGDRHNVRFFSAADPSWMLNGLRSMVVSIDRFLILISPLSLLVFFLS